MSYCWEEPLTTCTPSIGNVPLSVKDIARIKASILDRSQSFFDDWLGRDEGAVARIPDYFGESFFGIGTGADEFVDSREAWVAGLQEEWEQIEDGFDYTVLESHVRVYEQDAAVVLFEITVRPAGQPNVPASHLRLSLVFRHEDGAWRMVHGHASAPWEAQADGEAYPLDELKSRAEKLEAEVAQRTVELSRANRELEVDAALERIRRVTGEMSDPSDLIEVVKQIRLEVGALYGDNVVEVGLMQEADKDSFKFWSVFDIKDVPEDLALFGLLYPKKPDPPHPMLDRVWRVEGAYSLLFFDLDDLWRIHASLEHYSPEEADGLRVILESGELEGGWQTVSKIQVGRMYLGWLQEPPEELALVQPRIAAVLSEAQKRVEELQTAHRMRREAEIEAAMERIRGRALAMRSSKELKDIVLEIRRQIDGLGQMNIEASVVHLYTEGAEFFRSIAAVRPPGHDGEIVTAEVAFPTDRPLVIEQMMEKWHSDATEYTIELDRQMAEDWQRNMMEHAPVIADRRDDYIEETRIEGHDEWWNFSEFSEGAMLLVTHSPPTSDTLVVLRKTAEVFDLAYQRYRDLEKAEAQAREAQIEAALERIRRVSGEMTQPSDLTAVVRQIKRELNGLYGNEVWETTLMMEADEDNFRFWSIQDAEEVPDSLEQFGVLFPKVSDPKHPMIDRWWNAEGAFTELSSDLEEAWQVHASLSVYLPHEAELVKAMLDSGTVEESWHTVSSIRDGRMFLIWGAKPPAEVAAVQPRMAAVLSEAQKRAEELQRAKEMTREAQIETALERVRGRAMAMRSSGELNEVADELRRQMALLGQTELEVCTIHIYDIEGEDFESWGVINDPSREGPVETEVRLFPRKGVPILEEIIAAYESEENNHVFLNDGEKAAGFFGMLRDRHPDVLERLMALIPPGVQPADMKAWWSFSDFSGGSLGIVTYKPADPESLDLLERTARVFDLAYRRFKDLREAEEAEREAQIEAALERVRSRSLAMQSSDELMDVAQVLFQQLIALGMDPDTFETCGFVIFRDGTRIGDTFLTQLDGSPLAYTFSAEYGGDRATREHWDAWEKRQPIALVHLVGDELTEHLDYLADMSGEPVNRFHEMADVPVPPGSYNYSANFKHGYVAVITTEPQEDAETLYPRFARVFEQAYTRFLDLKKAEAATREAQVEAALERVRSKATGMRNADELLEVVATIHREYSGLGFACGVFWHARYHEDHYEKALTAIDGSRVSTTMILPRDFSAVPELAEWERGNEPFGVFQFDADAGGRYMEHMISKGRFMDVDPNAVTPEIVRDHGGITFVQARTTSGEIGYSLWGEVEPEPESKEVLLRFARVFDLAHRRFEDLTEAEAAAREARIETALERVRAHAMGMTNSDELLAVVATIHQQFSGLGFDCGTFWHGRYHEDRYEKALTARDGSKVATLMILPRPFPSRPEWPVWETSNQPLGVFKYNAEIGVAIFEDLISLGQFQEVDPNGISPDEVKANGGITFVQARTTHGEIGYTLWGEAEPDPEATEVLQRFARVFDLAHRRYEDLNEAEAAARNAQINLAVEKVRARAMAMHGSEEMAEVASTLRDQLQELGVEGVSSSTVYTEQGGGRYRIWDMANIQGVEDSAVTLDFTFHPDDAIGEFYFRDILGADGYSSFHYEGERLKAISDWLRGHDPTSADTMDRLIKDEDLTDLWISSYPVQRGYLSVDTVVPPSEELAVIMPRMASAFDLAYRRFEDLKEAEAATREARIDAALERLRSRTMAMTSSDELLDVSSVMTQLLVDLGLSIHWAYVFLYNEAQDQMETYLTKSTTHPVDQAAGKSGLWTYPRYFHDPDKDESEFLRAWKQRDATRTANWEVSRFDEWADHFQMMFDDLGYSRDDYRPYVPNGIFNTEALMGPGYVGMGGANGFTEVEVDILARFAREFEGTYRRFLDIQRAEAQARESRIEAALERVRSQAMAMQKPDDISGVSIRMFEELEGLGIESLRSGIAIPEDGERYVFRSAIKDDEGDTILVLGGGSIDMHPYIRRAYDGWKEQEPHQVITMEGDDLNGYYQAVFDSLPKPDLKARMVRYVHLPGRMDLYVQEPGIRPGRTGSLRTVRPRLRTGPSTLSRPDKG